MKVTSEKQRAFAIAKSVPISVQKMRAFSKEIRRKSVEEAYKILAFAPGKAPFLLKKVLHSSASNAEHNHGLSISQLFVEHVLVTRAAALKRLEFRGRGRTGKIRKPRSHIKIIVGEVIS